MPNGFARCEFLVQLSGRQSSVAQVHHQELEIVRAAVRRFLIARWPDDSLSGPAESILLKGLRVIGHQFVCTLPRTSRDAGAGKPVQIRWLAGETQLQIREPEQPVYTWDWRSTSVVQRAA